MMKSTAEDRYTEETAPIALEYLRRWRTPLTPATAHLHAWEGNMLWRWRSGRTIDIDELNELMRAHEEYFWNTRE